MAKKSEKFIVSLMSGITWAAMMALAVAFLALCLGAMTHAIAWCVSMVAA